MFCLTEEAECFLLQVTGIFIINRILLNDEGRWLAWLLRSLDVKWLWGWGIQPPSSPFHLPTLRRRELGPGDSPTGAPGCGPGLVPLIPGLLPLQAAHLRHTATRNPTGHWEMSSGRVCPGGRGNESGKPRLMLNLDPAARCSWELADHVRACRLLRHDNGGGVVAGAVVRAIEPFLTLIRGHRPLLWSTCLC